MHWVFYFNEKNPIYANKTMVLFQQSVVNSWHHHWGTLAPLPYNLNLSAIELNKLFDIMLISMSWQEATMWLCIL